MNQKEILVLAVGIFLTIVAWMIIDIYHIQTQEVVDTEIKPVTIPQYKIDTHVFDDLLKKTP